MKWERISREQYAQAYQQFGGSFINHPEVLNIISHLTDVPTTYYGCIEKVSIIGAIATWGRRHIAGDGRNIRKYKIDKKIDFGYPDLILPLSSEYEFTSIPFSGRYLASVNSLRLKKFKARRFIKMSISKYDLIIPNNVQNKWNQKLRKFKSIGGEWRSIQEFNAEEIADLYTKLHQIRWKKPPATSTYLSRNLQAFYEYLHGSVMFLNNDPIAIQINFAVSNPHYLTVDFVNGGTNKLYQNLNPGPGTLLFYINLTSKLKVIKIALFIWSFR